MTTSDDLKLYVVAMPDRDVNIDFPSPGKSFQDDEDCNVYFTVARNKDEALGRVYRDVCKDAEDLGYASAHLVEFFFERDQKYKIVIEET